MLKPISRLRSICKGDLNHNTNLVNKQSRQNGYYSCSITRVSKRILHSIPVLSIFVLLGIMGYGTIVIGFGEVDDEAYAAETVSNNTSLIIDNGTPTDSTATVRNGVAYSSHTVQVKADNITGYTLSITGPTNLSNGYTTISGAGGKTGSTMNDNTWGYGWNTTSTANANMTYNSFTGNAQTLENNASATSANFTKKLVFAAKFNQNAAEGHYRANVKLNLTVTPKTLTGDYSVTYNMNGGTGGPENMSITNDPMFTSYKYTIPNDIPTRSNYFFMGWSDDDSADIHNTKYKPGSTINLTTANSNVTLSAVWAPSWDIMTTMQQMTPQACASATISAEKTLIDTRDNNASSYLIRKLKDGNCWMTTNLTLDLSKAGVATVAESDNLTSAYPSTDLPNRWSTSTTNAWQNDETIAQFSKSPQKKADSSGTYQSSYGYYYNSRAVAAGAAASSSGSMFSRSICPKGWRLPIAASESSKGDFYVLGSKGAKNEVSSYQRILLGASTETDGGVYFLAAGYVDSNGLNNGGTVGNYWSRTINYITHTERYLTFSSSYINLEGDYGGNYYGRSVRCVAYSS